jgi:uncharacterized protein YdeI (YjbR/CyaY-like superfamily)
MAKDLEELTVPDAVAWRAWLAAHHEQPDGVWLTLAKKGTTSPTDLRYAAALDEALCFGWIDGQARKGDDRVYSQKFTPRRARSPWSARNVGRIARLESEGRMSAAGRAEVDRAKADGRWDDAYAGPAGTEVPDDLAAALAAEPKAQAMFDILTSTNRFAVIHRLRDAKRPETRARRLEQFVAMLARGETLYPQKATLPPAR